MKSLVLLLGMLLSPIYSMAIPADCQCPKVSCNDPCKEPSGNLEFFTESCDGGNRVKSCAKVNCVFKSPLPEACLAKHKKSNKKQKMTASNESAHSNWIREKEVKNVQIGVVTFSKGKSWLFRKGKKKKLKLGKKIFLQDMIETGINGKLKIMFKDNNSINLSPKSKMKIAEYVMGRGAENSSALLELIYGQIRPKVKRKYKGTTTSRFQVKSKVAVAGVRGTDFVVSFRPEKAIEMKVETLYGEVELSSNDRRKFVWIPAGNTSKFVANKEDYEALKQGEGLKSVRGHLTLMEKMSKKYQKSLSALTDFDPKSSVARLADMEGICANPRGSLNQCSWTCEGANKGLSRRCPTEREGVRCIRRRCDANGNWTDNMRMPASSSSSCMGDRAIVAPCDY